LGFSFFVPVVWPFLSLSSFYQTKRTTTGGESTVVNWICSAPTPFRSSFDMARIRGIPTHGQRLPGAYFEGVSSSPAL